MSKVSDRNQRELLELLKVPGNSTCADCRANAPRWAAWNWGVFLCMTCAGLHRKMGTDVSRVKSCTLDVWTREQVEGMRSKGNARSNELLNPNEGRNPPPTSFDESERNGQLERFIRAKYEKRSFAEVIPRPRAVSATSTMGKRPSLDTPSSFSSTASSPDRGARAVRFLEAPERSASLPVFDLPPPKPVVPLAQIPSVPAARPRAQTMAVPTTVFNPSIWEDMAALSVEGGSSQPAASPINGLWSSQQQQFQPQAPYFQPSPEPHQQPQHFFPYSSPTLPAPPLLNAYAQHPYLYPSPSVGTPMGGSGQSNPFAASMALANRVATASRPSYSSSNPFAFAPAPGPPMMPMTGQPYYPGQPMLPPQFSSETMSTTNPFSPGYIQSPGPTQQQYGRSWGG